VQVGSGTGATSASFWGISGGVHEAASSCISLDSTRNTPEMLDAARPESEGLAVDAQHVWLGGRLRVRQQALPDALLGPAPEALLGRLGRRDEACKLGPGAIASQDGKAGAEEAPQRVQVMQVHVQLLRQSRQHTLPQSIFDMT
jgi:hypothetical protein